MYSPAISIYQSDLIFCIVVPYGVERDVRAICRTSLATPCSLTSVSEKRLWKFQKLPASVGREIRETEMKNKIKVAKKKGFCVTATCDKEVHQEVQFLRLGCICHSNYT